MKYYLLIFALVTSSILLGSPFCSKPRDVPRNRIRYETKDKRVVQVETETGPNCWSSCSGFIEENGIVITASHCLGNKKPGSTGIVIIFIDGSIEKFTIVINAGYGIPDFETIPEYRDYAVLKGNTKNYPHLPFATSPPELPLRTFSMGYGRTDVQGALPVIAEMYYKGLVLYDLELTGLIDAGDSGGPVLGPNNTVIGIVIRADFKGISAAAVPYQIVVEAMKREKIK